MTKRKIRSFPKTLRTIIGQYDNDDDHLEVLEDLRDAPDDGRVGIYRLVEVKVLRVARRLE